jgi:Methyltransferase domain/C-methyltransferase C-terminal domain
VTETLCRCPLCKGGKLDLVLSRPKSASLQNRTFESAAQARAAVNGRLDIVRCRDCGFIHNKSFDPMIIDYTEEYEIEQGVSPRFRAHMMELAGDVRSAVAGEAPLSIVDIGCNQGSFLKLVIRELKDMHARGFGFDPAYRGPAQDSDGISYYRNYFDSGTSRLVTGGEFIFLSRHVIEHVPDPLQFLRSIRAAVPDVRRTRLFIETPCVEWIFRKNSVQDFFYEHCNYWTAESLGAAAERAGFTMIRYKHVFEGQFLWMELAPITDDAPPSHSHIASVEGKALVETYKAREDQTIAAWRRCITAAALNGPVALWGAGAKGVTMAALIDPACELIDCLIDINPRKQNRYIPITAHPVVSLKSAQMRGVRTALVMNRNYLADIREMHRHENVDIGLIDETMVHVAP